ncbi:MAG: hypothetical protein ACPL1G_00805 [Thermodesulfovibrionales bacterium]
MAFEKVIHKYFDKVLTEVDFVKKTYNALEKYGFNDENAIASVCICRDEISQPLRSIIKHIWGEAFDLSSLGGMFFAGKAGLKAIMHHAPVFAGKERYVFYALPHIAIGENGKLGVCKRRGRKEESNACGALTVFLNELSSKKLNIAMDYEDIELSLIRTRLLRELTYGHVPDLIQLTKIALKAIKEDIENALKKTIDKKHSDYALIMGIQINAPDGNYIWPAECYVFVNGIKKDVTL